MRSDAIAIVGLGLIGGSIALAARRRWPSLHIVGIDRPEIVDRALGCRAISHAAVDLNALGAADLVVLAAPVSRIIALLAELPGRVRPGALVTDVGSTKRAILKAAANFISDFAFIGGHPLAGAATSGFESASAELFAGRRWLLTPSDKSRPDHLDRLCAFVSGLGASPDVIDASTHDRVMAALSHLPQLAASSLMRVAGEMTMGDGLGLAGAGLCDTTRLASSPPDIWTDICASNADHIGTALDEYIEVLTQLRRGLADADAVARVFGPARQSRARLEQALAANAHGAAAAGTGRVPVEGTEE
ncbi:MAG: prephenate dehydrogenase/arogenate dehydrogenase family protein [Acidobacteria bacterium]|nr:prephenate dehydrogenase/arogenate dehydrogenase family protein [Acidobacteriota bacterium]